MSRQVRWKQSPRKRAAALLLIACGVVLTAGVCRHFEDFEAELKPAADEEVLRERMLHWTPVRTLGRAFEEQEWRIYDMIHRRAHVTAVDPEIVVLGIDEGSMTPEATAEPEEIAKSRALQLMAGGWPWSREVYALALERLLAAGARTVVIDLMLPAPSATAPEGDAAFKAALDKYKGRVLIAADFTTAANGGVALALPWDGFVPSGWPADERIGMVSVWPHADGVIRTARFFHSETNEPERALPSFAAAVMRLQGRPEIIPLDAPDHFFRFGPRDAYRPWSLMDIFVPALWERNFGGGGFFKGKTVFIGPTAQSLQDFKETPVGTILGVQLHAHALGALKGGSFVRMAPLSVRAGLLVALVFAAWLLVVVLRRPLWVMFVLIAGIALGFVAQWWLFDAASLIVPFAVPVLGWALCGFTGLTFDYVLERKSKEALRRRIGRFHSPDMVAAILADPDDYERSLAGAKRTIALLFSDVRGFTTMSESMPPEEMIAQLTEYLDRMVEVVFKHNGAIDKFIGDAVMAAWGRLRNAQDEALLKRDALDAVATAIEMLEALGELNAAWKQRGMEALHIGIGIHQGEAIVGELGSGKSEFTAIGDTVNSASRLESATKQYGVDLIISDVVRERVKDAFVCRTADLVKVKGKTKPMEVFTVQGRAGTCDAAEIATFENGVRLFREGKFAEALVEFEKARAGGLDDGLTTLYRERCDELIAAPPESWDGVWTMTKK
ncbi:MAG: adenylate/guanylate cyclase domain-containing protein [Verrucomicrobiaceae bacterium]|nr:adenylate/guanylate cyclase domain-containing protein [Verrucomicrobiaceae bacterium]